MKKFRNHPSKVVGVKNRNSDRTERQEIIKKCKIGDRVILKHDPNNALSDYAMNVLRENGQQLGLLPDLLGENVLERIKKGQEFFVYISNLTGGDDSDSPRRVDLIILTGEEGADEVDAQAWAFNLLRDKLGPLLITFECEHCGIEMEIEDTMQGEWINCVECGAEVQIPHL